ncbi:MAG: hypothetical protein IJX90_12015 [Blautia sp.]|nr:hypothetical protein [Blautia sp.]
MKKLFHRCRPLLILAVFATLLISVPVMAKDKTVNVGKLKNGGYLDYEGTTQSHKFIYHRINVPSDGAVGVIGIRVKNGSKYSIKAAMCDSKKARIDYYTNCTLFDSGDDNSMAQVYGLKKGVYYLRMQNNSPGSKYFVTFYYLKYSNGGASKAKARSMSAGKKYSMLIGAGTSASTSAWYKLKVNGSRQVILTVSTEGQGTFKIQITGSRMNQSDTIKAGQGFDFTLYGLKGSKKIALSAGTYYVKLSKSSKRTNGYAELSWKYK